MNNRRQELYDRIRTTSKQEVIREEMVRLGFWKAEDGGPAAVTEGWLQDRKKLTSEINELAAKQRKFTDRAAMLKEMRKRRMATAKENRKATKERAEQERQTRAAAWAEQKKTDITYLGAAVSGGFNAEQTTDTEKLERFNLPPIANIQALAKQLRVEVNELRFLAYSRDVSKITHYRRFYMRKKSGGQRLISAPMPRLKAVQYGILTAVLNQVPVHDAAHGFAHNRSILTNARQHVGKDLVINLDLKDFFPSVSYARVKGLLRSLGYSEKVASVMGLICTEPEVDEVELDGERYYLHASERHLPQGAPTSPAITNILCYRLDRRMAGMAAKLGFVYTRYADDMTFSASGEAAESFKQLLWRARSIIKDEGFELHPDKTRIMRRGRQQEVTGLTVNDQVSVPRRELRSFRALLHHIEKDGFAGKQWHGSERNLLAAIRGYAYFIRMVDPTKGESYVAQVERILTAEDWKHVIRHPAKPPEPGPKKATPPPLPQEQSTFGRILKKLQFWK